METNTIFGGWVDNSPLVGVAGLRVESAHGGIHVVHRYEAETAEAPWVPSDHLGRVIV